MAGFSIATFSLSIIMKLIDMGFYGELVGLVALLSEVLHDLMRVYLLLLRLFKYVK